MIKPWSISTTVRSPERLRAFLQVLKLQEGEAWDKEAQKKFHIHLIQQRSPEFLSPQFLSGIGKDLASQMFHPSRVSHEVAEAVFYAKNYKDTTARPKMAIKPLLRLNLATFVDGKITITLMGKSLMADEGYSDVWRKCLLKWQLPNSFDSHVFPHKHGYFIKPFVGILKLVAELNRQCRKSGEEENGISWDELAIFGLTLVDYRKINSTAREIVHYRKRTDLNHGASVRKNIVSIGKQYRPQYDLRNVGKLTDNVGEYLRITDLFRILPGGRYINLEPHRGAEIRYYLDTMSAKPDMSLVKRPH